MAQTEMPVSSRAKKPKKKLNPLPAAMFYWGELYRPYYANAIQTKPWEEDLS